MELEQTATYKVENSLSAIEGDSLKCIVQRTAKSPQQVAEDMAWILENKMENKIVARKLWQLTFGEL